MNGTSYINENYGFSFIELNSNVFLEYPTLVQCDNLCSVSFKIDEETLQNVGFLMLTSIATRSTSWNIQNASVLDALQLSPAYTYFSSELSNVTSSSIRTALVDGKAAAYVKLALSDYDNITGFIGKKKVLQVCISFYNSKMSSSN